ncbi:RNA methyltransferase [Parabacteroides sp. 52]|nr:RNA methyltransferase [Parabacteroides sp. 52]
MVAKTLYGLEDILAGELTTLGANDLQIGRRMVSFTGDKELLYKANFCCRTALRILKPIYHFKAKDADTVYNEVKKVKWENYMSLEKTFAIDSVIFSEDFNHSKFVAYRTKDAIVDYFMEKYEKRPSVRVNNPDLYINIHISHNDCTLSIDSSGESLHKRGYRVEQTEAPLNEVLAAGMILKTGWKGESNFVDPMCGSGTLLIEAAMIALNIAPGIHRKEFAFEKWIDFDQEIFDRIYNDESKERVFDYKCYGYDISPVAIETAQKNIRSAGLVKYIELNVLPFQQFTEAPQPGILVTNPPYGERISTRDLLGLYGMIGERLKHVFTGYKAWILSYKDECFDKIGLRPSEKMKLLNGSLECEYRCFEMFDGKNKEYKKALNEEGEGKRPPFVKKAGEQAERKVIARRPDFKKDRMDRPDRRFAAAHAEEEDDRTPFIPGKRFFGEERSDGRPARKQFADKRSDKKSFHKDDKDFGKRPFKKPFKKRGKDEF